VTADGNNMAKQEVPWEQNINENTERKVLELCNIKPDEDNSGLTLLDSGCGNGRYLEVFRKYLSNQNLYGTEISADRVNSVRDKGFNCVYLASEAELPFEDNFFDIVFSSNVIEHIQKNNYHYYLEEVHRVLKNHGRFVVGTPNYPIKRFYDILKAFSTKMYKYYLFDDPTHYNKLSIGRLEKDLSKYYPEVQLEPSYIIFEDKIKTIRKYRNKLRYFGDKISGYCLKKAGET
jgi:ubiquinone/menaquinone biosynthesis C-methylase UbiE